MNFFVRQENPAAHADQCSAVALDLTAARPSVRIPTFPTRGSGWPFAHRLCWYYISYCADIEGEPKINRPD